MSQQVKHWSQVASQRDRELHLKAPEIKRWREQEHEAGSPSDLEDFFRVHGLCFTCKATGTRLDPVGWDEKVPLFEECPVCGGTGKLSIQ